MDEIKGYEIKQAIVFDNDRGIAMGENPAAPAPFVTWQFSEENGKRDYYWGKYFTDGQAAQDNFSFRVEKYRNDMEVTEKPGTQLHRPDFYRYYSTQRPVDINTFPEPKGNEPVTFMNYDQRIPVENGLFRAWGVLTYLKPLTGKETEDYELRPASDNPNRAKGRPSITARLKENAAHRQEPTREAPKVRNMETQHSR